MTPAGTHIGKVMIEMTDAESQGPQAATLQHVARAVQPQFACREDRSYIVTGGLGGYAFLRLLQKKAGFSY